MLKRKRHGKNGLISSAALTLASWLPGLFMASILSAQLLTTDRAQREEDIPDWLIRAADYLPKLNDRWFFYVATTVLVMIFLVASLKILNDNFSTKNFSWRRFWHENQLFVVARISEYFLLSLLLITALARLIMEYSLPLAIIFGNSVFWILWHRDGVWGDWTCFDYRNKEACTPWKIWPKFRGIGMVFLRSLFFGAFLMLIQYVIVWILDRPQLLINYLINYRDWFTSIDHARYFFLAFSMTAFFLPLLNLAARRYSSRELAVRLVFPMALAIVMLLAVWRWNFEFMSSVDLEKNALDIVNLETANPSKRTFFAFEPQELVRRTFNAEVNFRTIDLRRRSATRPGDPRLVLETIPCNSQNDAEVEALKNMAATKGNRSALFNSYLSYGSGKGGFGLVYGCNLFNFEVARIVEDRFLALKESGDRLSLLTFLTNTARLGQPVEFIVGANTFQDIDEFIKKTKWNIEEMGAVGDWYYHNGKSGDAEFWYKQLIEARQEEEGTSKGVPAKSLPGIFSGGLVQGKFILELEMQNSAKIIKVALLKKNIPGKSGQKGIVTANLVSGVFLNGYSLMAATNLQQDGRFVFEKVIEGQYLLAVLAEGEQNWSFANNLGFINIEKQNALWNLGEIKASY